MPVSLHSIAPVLPVNDVLETLAWYEQKLGFSLCFIYPDRHPEYGAAARGGVELHFFHAKVNPLENEWMCYLRVSNVDALYAEYKAKSIIHPNGPLETKPWGGKEFAVTDLNGALLRFGELRTDQSAER
jgi:uncharacterized glyoxalase superfamily protein PhnB